MRHVFKKERFFFARSLTQNNGNCFLPALYIMEKMDRYIFSGMQIFIP